MNRRDFILATGGAALGSTSLASTDRAHAEEPPGPFGRHSVVQAAKELAAKEFKALPEVPESFGKLGYDQYRDIRFRKELAYWLGQDRGFTLELLHAGFIYKTPVAIHVIEEGVAKPISYNSHLFDFGPNLRVTPTRDQPLFSGIRLTAPIHTVSRSDEFLVFQGASYFRSLGAGQIYGASARGLAIDTAEPKGEEFPFFRSLWVERPERGAKTVVVHALLDSPSVTGAYSFHITPGASTLMEVDATLFARNDLHHLGIAPLTSMFMFSSIEATRFPDYRLAVHDSDTLAIHQHDGSWLLRPLANPKALQVSAFAESGVRGYGLQQRARAYEDFKDLEARYELRPSIWVEPKNHWGEGQVELVEIPSDREFNDNIVAFWRPRKALARGQSRTYSYWLRWGWPVAEKWLATLVEMRGGLTINRDKRLFVVDFARPKYAAGTDAEELGAFFGGEVKPQVFASKGAVSNVVGQPNAVTGGYRVSFELDAGGVDLSELRLMLVRGNETISETWLYRWTA